MLGGDLKQTKTPQKSICGYAYNYRYVRLTIYTMVLVYYNSIHRTAGTSDTNKKNNEVLKCETKIFETKILDILNALLLYFEFIFH